MKCIVRAKTATFLALHANGDPRHHGLMSLTPSFFFHVWYDCLFFAAQQYYSNTWSSSYSTGTTASAEVVICWVATSSSCGTDGQGVSG